MNSVNRFYVLRIKKLRILNKISFLKRCRNHKVIPNFLKVYFKRSVFPRAGQRSFNRTSSPRVSENLFKCCMAIVRSMIKDHRGFLANVEMELYNLHLLLGRSRDDFAKIDARSYHRAQHASSQHQHILSKKFSTLLNSRPKQCFRKFSDFSNSPKIVNLSSFSLTNAHTNVLEKGLNFASQSSICPTRFLAPIERSFSHSKLLPDQKESLRHLISSVVSSNRITHPPPLSKEEFAAAKELQNNPDIIVSRADKGGQVVLLDKSLYKDSVEKLISEGPYVCLPKDPSPSFLKKVQKEINHSVLLSSATKKRIFPSAAHCGRFYALPKVHKPSFSTRPITSCIGTPSYKLAKLLVQFLSPLCSVNQFSVKNSIDFAAKIRNVQPDNCTMVSFDVKSMFTNIPISGALSSLRSRLEEFHFTSLEIDELCNFTDLCISFNFFTVFGKFYRQTDGLAMGNPLSPILCEIYMDCFEKNLLRVCPFKLWIRYVDDTFTLIDKNPDDLDDIISSMNSIDPHVQFTCEVEQNNQLPFLDVLVERHPTMFRTSIFRKPFAVSMPPHAKSHHAPQHKLSAFYAFVHRALNICSDESSLHLELNVLRDIATDRGFSPCIIDKILRKLSGKTASSLIPFSDVKSSGVVIIPFLPVTSFKISSILKKFSFQVVFQPISKTIISQLKDPIPAEKESGIYFMPCKDCNQGYIGQTRRNLGTRLTEHRKNVEKCEVVKSAVAKHSWDHSHCIDFKQAIVFRKASSNWDLDFLEGFFIRCCSEFLLNDGRNTPPVSSAWKNLIRQCSQKVLSSLRQVAPHFGPASACASSCPQNSLSAP